MVLYLVCGTDFRCVLHPFSSLTRLEGSWGQAWPESWRKLTKTKIYIFVSQRKSLSESPCSGHPCSSCRLEARSGSTMHSDTVTPARPPAPRAYRLPDRGEHFRHRLCFWLLARQDQRIKTCFVNENCIFLLVSIACAIWSTPCLRGVLVGSTHCFWVANRSHKVFLSSSLTSRSAAYYVDTGDSPGFGRVNCRRRNVYM